MLSPNARNRVRVTIGAAAMVGRPDPDKMTAAALKIDSATNCAKEDGVDVMKIPGIGTAGSS